MSQFSPSTPSLLAPAALKYRKLTQRRPCVTPYQLMMRSIIAFVSAYTFSGLIEADSVTGDLQAKEDGEGDKISGIHGTPWVRFDCRGWGWMGETQSIFWVGARVEQGGFEEGTE